MKKYTYSAKRSDNKENWCVIDAKDKILGRLASQVAYRIRGKNNPLFSPHVDTGDWIIIINAEKIPSFASASEFLRLVEVFMKN